MNSAIPLRRPRGFSLIELLVAMAIGLIVTLAVTSVLVRSEGSKRSSTSINEINQTGAYAAFTLDRTIRSAGSGYSQLWSVDYGCLLDAAKGGAPLLPIPAAISASSAFTKLTGSTALPIRLAPLIIAKDYADTGAETRGDVLLVMSGSAGAGELPQPVNPGSVTTTNLQLPNTLGYRTEDLVLLADPAQTSCMLQQVKFTTTPPSATFAPGSPQPGGSTDQELPFGNGTPPGYYRSTGTNVNLTAFGANSLAIQLGSAVDNRPQFVAYGVGQDRTLYSFDLFEPLPTGTSNPDTPVADGVLELRAIYGIDTTNPPDGTVDAWVPATGNFLASTLLDGSAASKSRLRRIVAVRVGMILRTSLQEKAPATSASGPTDTETFSQAIAANLTLFSGYSDPSGTSLAYTRPITTDEKRYRYRAVESTIPLRNVQLADSASVLAYP